MLNASLPVLAAFIAACLGWMLLPNHLMISGCMAQESRNSSSSQNGSDGQTPLGRQFAENGVQFPTGDRFVLPAPTLEHRQSDQRVMEQLAGRFGWERFSRNHLNAPVAIDVEEVRGENGDKLGLAIHSSYIAYANPDRLRDRDLIESTFGQSAATQGDVQLRELSPEELQSLGIAKDGESENYLWIELPLLRKVMIRGLLHVQANQSEDGIEVYWQLEPRLFEQQTASVTSSASAGTGPRGESASLSRLSRYRNTWSSLSANELGALVEGPPHAYVGLAGYTAVHATGRTDQQLLVESRMIIHEPRAWFGGSNYLRSKLPLSVQDGAKKFRRKLAELAKNP